MPTYKPLVEAQNHEVITVGASVILFTCVRDLNFYL